MRRKSLLAVALVACTAPAMAQTLYDANNPGFSDIGSTGNYTTLADAITALNTAGRATGAGVWEFRILENLSNEPNSVISADIAADAGVIFKPAASTTPTVTFTASADNAGVSGNLIFGVTNLTSLDAITANPVRNITIDGSNNGGTSRDLTLTNLSTTTANNGRVVRIWGNVTGIVVKNANLINEQTGTATHAIDATMRAVNSTLNGIPSNITISNNLLRSTAGSVSGDAGVNLTVSGTASNFSSTATITGVVIEKNNIEAQQRGIFLNAGAGWTIDRNTIDVNCHNNSALTTDAIFVNDTNPNTASAITGWTAVVSRNVISRVRNVATATNQSTRGMILSPTRGIGTWDVSNNIVTGIDCASTNSGTSATVRGISMGGPAGQTWRVYNNSVNIAPQTNWTGASTVSLNHGIGNPSGNAAVLDYKNNIVRWGHSRGAALQAQSGTIDAAISSDYNIVYVDTPSANANVFVRGASNFSTLALWQAHTAPAGQDVNSFELNPVSSWQAETGANALLLVGEPAPTSTWTAPRLTTSPDNSDVQGNARQTPTYRGADEPSTWTNVTDWTVISE